MKILIECSRTLTQNNLSSHTRAVHWILLTNDLKRVEPTRKWHEFGFIGWIRQKKIAKISSKKWSIEFLEKSNISAIIRLSKCIFRPTWIERKFFQFACQLSHSKRSFVQHKLCCITNRLVEAINKRIPCEKSSSVWCPKFSVFWELIRFVRLEPNLFT